MRPIRAGCVHEERKQRLESSHGLGHVLYYKAQKGKDTGSHDVQKPLQEAQRIPPDRTHTHRKSPNKERKSHGSGLTLCCIWMCSKASFNFAWWHYNDGHNITFRDFKWWSLLLHCKASWFLCRFCQLWCWLLRKRKPNDTLQHKDSSQIMHWMCVQFSSPITPAYFKKTCSFLMRIQLIWTRVMLTHLRMSL